MTLRRIALFLTLALCALVGAVVPARAHDTAVSGIRILYRRHDIVVTVTTALSRLQKAEEGRKEEEEADASEALDTAIRRRLKLQLDDRAAIWPKATILADRAGDLLCWQTVIRTPLHTLKALGPLYPEDPASNTVVTILRDGQAVEETLLTAVPAADLSKSRSEVAPARGLKAAFTRSIAARRLTPATVFVALALAFLFGAAHALSPGHGKTMVAAALVGTRGTVRHAVLLGAVVTLTHTVGVFALGLITLGAAQQAVPERLYPLLSLLSGAMIVCVGANLFARQMRRRRRERNLEESYEDEEEGEGVAAPLLPTDGKFSLRSLLVLGITGGAVPCPSALVVMLSAMALHRIAFGLVLICAFSLGLAVVLTGVGLLVVRLGTAAERLPWNAGLLTRLPMISAATVVFTGIVFIWRAFQGGSF